MPFFPQLLFFIFSYFSTTISLRISSEEAPMRRFASYQAESMFILFKNFYFICQITNGTNMEHEYHLSCQRSKTIDKKACVLLFYIFVLFYGFLSFVGAKIRLFSQCAKFYFFSANSCINSSARYSSLRQCMSATPSLISI